MSEVGIDGATVLFVTVVGAIAASALAVAPLALTSGRALRSGLREGGRGASGSRLTGALRTGLVVLEFALVLPLMVAGSLLITSLLNLNSVDPGFDPHNVVAVPVGLPNAGYSDWRSREVFWREARLALAEARAALLAAAHLPQTGPEDLAEDGDQP